jgi:poly-gamma-glutamate synthesis protein (capsule biosynthesis protein)
LFLTGDNVGILNPAGLGFYYERISETLSGADLRFGNLEWPLAEGIDYDPVAYARPRGTMRPTDIDALVGVGFDVMSMANNHMMDYGQPGMLKTVELLDSVGIAHCGAGDSSAAAHQPAILERNGLRVAFLAYTAVYIEPRHPQRAEQEEPQMATLEVSTRYEVAHRVFEQPGTPPEVLTEADAAQLKTITDEVSAARAAADVVVVSWHWGVSRGYRKRVDYQMAVGRACIDAGATVVVGTHPHVLQGVERYGDGLILYSLGNFVFHRRPKQDPNHDPFSVIVDCALSGDGLGETSFIPVVHNEDFQPVLATGEDAVRVFGALQTDSLPLGTELRLDGDRIRL